MTEQAIFAAGCFWGVERSFRELPGVDDVACGYIGGKSENPTYKQICKGDTGHAEAVRVSFDSTKISFCDLVEHFYTIHDPTQKDRQGVDIGRQYRSAIFTLNPEQNRKANETTKKSQANFSKPIATEITAAEKFYRAEDYHQDYFGTAKKSAKLEKKSKKWQLFNF